MLGFQHMNFGVHKLFFNVLRSRILSQNDKLPSNTHSLPKIISLSLMFVCFVMFVCLIETLQFRLTSILEHIVQPSLGFNSWPSPFLAPTCSSWPETISCVFLTPILNAVLGIQQMFCKYRKERKMRQILNYKLRSVFNFTVFSLLLFS